MSNRSVILFVIVLSQFCGTSVWFAGNGVMPDLVAAIGLNPDAVAHLTSAIQLGFISGTLVFALLTIADRFSPSKVFLFSALCSALFNLGIIWEGNTLESLLALRFATGFFLAGIYPVGMKIAADYFDKDLGKSLGLLVGALVLGTAFPHLLKGFLYAFPWTSVLITTSALAAGGGLLMAFTVPDGPYRKPGQRPDFSAFFKVFKKPAFRSAAFGYFGHMWELYTFWMFVPVMLLTYSVMHPAVTFNIPLWSFLIIGIGGPACVLGGYLSASLGVKKTAAIVLSLSGICCLLSPLLFTQGSPILFLAFLLFWGMAVIADSPMFSTLVAQNAEAEIKGTALTIVNSIGFAITIISIQLLNILRDQMDLHMIYLILAIGPAMGLVALFSVSSER